MPFTKNTDKGICRLGGYRGSAVRWGDRDPSTVRSKKVALSMSQAELELISAKAKTLRMSRSELLIRAAIGYKP